jgi:hypothetical protein
MTNALCLGPINIMVQTYFDCDINLKEDLIISKSNPYFFSYLSYMLKAIAGSSAYNICISQIPSAYA